MAAPDYVAPIVGWRGWFVVEAEGALRLCSIVYHTLWPPRQELVTSCRSSEYRLKPELPLSTPRRWRPAAAGSTPASRLPRVCRAGVREQLRKGVAPA
jgi:hypothetical protein